MIDASDASVNHSLVTGGDCPPRAVVAFLPLRVVVLLPRLVVALWRRPDVALLARPVNVPGLRETDTLASPVAADGAVPPPRHRIRAPVLAFFSFISPFLLISYRIALVADNSGFCTAPPAPGGNFSLKGRG